MARTQERCGGRATKNPDHYEIQVAGCLEHPWADAPDGSVVTSADRERTVLTVPIVDQAALHGVLRRLRDLGVRLISVNPIGPASDPPATEGDT